MQLAQPDMSKLISKETESDLLKLGLYQIFGGAIGILLVAVGIYRDSLIDSFTVLLYILIVLIFSYSIFCGMLCIKASRRALKYSLANQILQLFGFAAMGFAFKYVAGVSLTVGLDLTDSLNFSFGAGISKFVLNLNLDRDTLELNVNLIAIGLVYWIDRLTRRVREEMEIRQVSEIGYE
jgi:hypothetical protein